MKDGFVKVAAVTPDIRVADVAYNTQNICKMIDETVAKGYQRYGTQRAILRTDHSGIQ